MKKLLLLFCLVLGFVGCNNAPMPPPSEATSSEIAEKLKNTLPNYRFVNVEKSEITGLYEIHGDRNIIYTDGNYLFIGRILTMDGGRDLTQEKIARLPAPKKVVDTTFALTVIDGNGAKEVIMVTDVECPFCISADMWFENANTTRKILLFPLNPGSKSKAISEHILCSDEPADEYLKIMAYVRLHTSAGLGEDELVSCYEGKAQLDEMQKAVNAAGFSGTPMFVINGELIEGANPKLKELIR